MPIFLKQSDRGLTFLDFSNFSEIQKKLVWYSFILSVGTTNPSLNVTTFQKPSL